MNVYSVYLYVHKFIHLCIWTEIVYMYINSYRLWCNLYQFTNTKLKPFTNISSEVGGLVLELSTIEVNPGLRHL